VGFQSAWDSHHAEVKEATPVGERVFAELRLTGRGTGSEAAGLSS
jgi:hypothetical protein